MKLEASFHFLLGKNKRRKSKGMSVKLLILPEKRMSFRARWTNVLKHVYKRTNITDVLLQRSAEGMSEVEDL